ncbi:MAG: hypothetical protein ACI8RC_002022, partial [Ilumatobacter sp.]
MSRFEMLVNHFQSPANRSKPVRDLDSEVMRSLHRSQRAHHCLQHRR